MIYSLVSYQVYILFEGLTPLQDEVSMFTAPLIEFSSRTRNIFQSKIFSTNFGLSNLFNDISTSFGLFNANIWFICECLILNITIFCFGLFV